MSSLSTIHWLIFAGLLIVLPAILFGIQGGIARPATRRARRRVGVPRQHSATNVPHATVVPPRKAG